MTIEERVDKLEREVSQLNEELKRAAQEVRAKRFILEDGNGTKRAELRINEDIVEVELTLYNVSGERCLALIGSSEGSGLWLGDGKGSFDASLGTRRKRAWLMLKGNDKKGRALTRTIEAKGQELDKY